jgi:hypothetical protein
VVDYGKVRQCVGLGTFARPLSGCGSSPRKSGDRAPGVSLTERSSAEEARTKCSCDWRSPSTAAALESSSPARFDDSETKDYKELSLLGRMLATCQFIVVLRV